MPRCIALTVAFLALSTSLAAQTPQTAAPSGNQSARPTPSTLTTGTQLVIVDVVVQDPEGNPVHGLKQTDFRLSESKSQQTIRNFDEHSADAPRKPLPPIPPLPPGTFTNYTPIPPDSTLNVLLLDTLNTQTKDQAYVRAQLLKYVQQADPGTRIAIFGLASHLTLLQGFTTNPAILRAAVETKSKIKPSATLANPSGNIAAPRTIFDDIDNLVGFDSSQQGALAQASASLRQFEGDRNSLHDQFRTRATLEAFNQLARYLSAFPGRKNLIWFSGSFPISRQADLDLNRPFEVAFDNSAQARETTALLARARVAVYPVDARDTLTPTEFSTPISAPAQSRPLTPGLRDQISQFDRDEANAHVTMVQFAEDTGGRAFYDGRPLIDSVKRSIESGSNYYTLTYSPANRDWKGEYRPIKVELQGETADRKLKLYYRKGYYADDPNNHKTTTASSLISPTSPAAVAPPTGSAAYAFAAMRRGAPTPTEIVFEVRVLPHATSTDDKPAPHNSPNPNGTFKGPFLLYDLEIAALPRNFQLTPAADGLRHGSIEYVTYVYDTDGHLLNTDTATIALALTPDDLAKISAAGLGYRQQISVPAKGESFLRIAVHDIPSGRFGVVEVPTSSVARLPPATTPH